MCSYGHHYHKSVWLQWLYFAMIYLICSSCGSNPPSLGAWYQHNSSLSFTRRFLINAKKMKYFFFFHDRNFYFPFKILSLQSTQTQLSCYFQRPLMEFSGKLRLLTLCRTGPQSWKEIAWHLVQPTNVLVHSCTVIDLTSFWAFTGLAITPWIFYSCPTVITVITFALLQNLLHKGFKVVYGW